jgi:hypothetical protein
VYIKAQSALGATQIYGGGCFVLASTVEMSVNIMSNNCITQSKSNKQQPPQDAYSFHRTSPITKAPVRTRRCRLTKRHSEAYAILFGLDPKLAKRVAQSKLAQTKRRMQACCIE